MSSVNPENNLSIQDIKEIISNNNELIVPFGKYNGKPFSMLISDTKYFDWCMQQPGIKEKITKITNMYNITINNSTSIEASKTPEHNRLQNLFLNEDFCKNFARQHLGLDELWKIYSCEFEGIFNWDVVLSFSRKKILKWKQDDGSYSEEEQEYINTTYFEIKPLLGDDYPNVLRKMKHQVELTDKKNTWIDKKQYVLLIENYSSEVTTREQLITIFKQANIKVKFLNNENKLTLKEENKMLKERIRVLEEELKLKN